MIVSVIHLVKNPTFHDCTKYIRIQYHFMRDMVEKGTILLKIIDIEVNLVDMLTKPVGRRSLIGAKLLLACRKRNEGNIGQIGTWMGEIGK